MLKMLFPLLGAILMTTACSQMKNGATYHAHGSHNGIVVPIASDGEDIGFAELKLHDDKGDLEFWLTTDAAGTEPLDVPMDTAVTVTFPEMDGQAVELAIRNDRQNEDESGTPTLRDDKTNYFIFPGDTGADASFLQGSDVATMVVIAIDSGEMQATTAPFQLSPHTH